jgi:hypothetical protein
MIGALFWPSKPDEESEVDLEGRRPNGSDHMPSSLRP